MTAQRIDFLGLPLDAGVDTEQVCQLLRKQGKLRLVTFINPQAWALARKHADYLPALQEMNYVLADGQGVVLVCRWLTGLPCFRVSFDMTSLADPFFKKAAAEQTSMMLMGGEPSVDENMQAKLQTYYPDLKIVGTMHGYSEFAPMIAMVMEKKPDAVIVGMGSPRQELFLLALGAAGYKGLAITCGGFFDQYLDANFYYPEWINRWHLRFAWRLCREPRRLWRRYLIDYQLFIWLALKALVEKYTPPKVQQAVRKAAEKAPEVILQTKKRIVAKIKDRKKRR